MKSKFQPKSSLDERDIMRSALASVAALIMLMGCSGEMAEDPLEVFRFSELQEEVEARCNEIQSDLCSDLTTRITMFEFLVGLEREYLESVESVRQDGAQSIMDNFVRNHIREVTPKAAKSVLSDKIEDIVQRSLEDRARSLREIAESRVDEYEEEYGAVLNDVGAYIDAFVSRRLTPRLEFGVQNNSNYDLSYVDIQVAVGDASEEVEEWVYRIEPSYGWISSGDSRTIRATAIEEVGFRDMRRIVTENSEDAVGLEVLDGKVRGRDNSITVNSEWDLDDLERRLSEIEALADQCLEESLESDVSTAKRYCRRGWELTSEVRRQL